MNALLEYSGVETGVGTGNIKTLGFVIRYE